MSLIQSKLVSTGLFFLFIFLSGFWLRRSGRPYRMLTVTIHKLIGLAAGIYLGLTVYRIYQISPLSTVQIVATAITVLLFVANVATGSLLSTNKPMPEAVSIINKWFPYITVIATGVTIYLLT
jgi:hypothetical protein